MDEIYRGGSGAFEIYSKDAYYWLEMIGVDCQRGRSRYSDPEEDVERAVLNIVVNLNALTQMMTIMTQLIQDSRNQSLGSDGDNIMTINKYLKLFQEMRLPLFKGVNGPIEVKNWLVRIRRFRWVFCPDERKVTSVTFNRRKLRSKESNEAEIRGVQGREDQGDEEQEYPTQNNLQHIIYWECKCDIVRIVVMDGGREIVGVDSYLSKLAFNVIATNQSQHSKNTLKYPQLSKQKYVVLVAIQGARR
ncbi:hypothetical protein IEQ34_010027 [Dendrobium chrysotoxum]|uniref:Uncharacterized protein n=1 Tax=Dendrobium chrysotoxum TaxID=161865 RepID=A0AAV7H3L6_DENCH|nr:hypothetical protein IEQ34_010027 [Dendrobium chrysotoxum]